MGKNNVNPPHYKDRGRERQGEDIVQSEHKETLRQDKKDVQREFADRQKERDENKGGD